MKKTLFANSNFYYGVIVYLIILLIWNILTVIRGNILGLLPAFIQIALVMLIITKNQYAKIGLKFFSLVVLIVAPVLQLLSILLKASIGEHSAGNVNKLFFSLLSFALGIIVLVLTNKTVRVYDSDIRS